MNEVSVNKAARDSASNIVETVDAAMEARQRGPKLAARFEAVEDDYRLFHDMLDGQNRRRRPAEGQQPDTSSLAIMLAKDYEHPLWGRGKLVAAFARNPNPHVLGPHYYTQVNFERDDDPGTFKFVESEMFGLNVVLQEMTPQRRERLRAAQPGMILMAGDYTPETVEELEAQLGAVLPAARETFSLLLTRACDPGLNPDLAEAAQACRNNLSGAG